MSSSIERSERGDILSFGLRLHPKVFKALNFNGIQCSDPKYLFLFSVLFLQGK